MRWLVFVTLLCAFSFSLIGEFLAGQVDGYIAVATRMLLAFLTFLPFLKWNSANSKTVFALMGIGAIQIGVMYLFFYHSFLFLSVPEVLLFTILTPVYVSLLDDLIFVKRFRLNWLLPAIIAVVGAAIIRYQTVSSDFWTGLLLVQAANLCFAFGQVAYKRLAIPSHLTQKNIFAFFFFGALLISLLPAIFIADWTKVPVTITHYATLTWLGIVASGLGYYFWNYGSKQVNTGQLATMNNLLIPAGILVNVVFWGRPANWLSLTFGAVIILASILIASYYSKAMKNKSADN